MMMQIKWKPINAGMVIGCRNEDEVNLLLDHLEDLGYRWVNGQQLTEWLRAMQFRTFQICDNYFILATTGKPNIMVSDLTEVEEEPVPSKPTSSENMNGGLKLKPIIPGMIIECQDEMEVRILLRYLERLGYRWKDGDRPTEWSAAGCFRTFLIDKDRTISACSRFSANVRFSDLIIDEELTGNYVKDTKELSAQEILEWLTTYQGTTTAKHCFGDSSDLKYIFEKYTAVEIVKKITAFEVSKGKKADVPETEEPKSEAPVKQESAEVETGYHCMICKGICGTAIARQYDLWGVSKDEAWTSVTEKAGALCAEYGGELSTMVWPICRRKGKEE